jgi:hypothetical protein
MAGPKSNLPDSSAEDTVFSNLGLTRDDLGMDLEGSGNEDLEGSGNEGGEGEGSGQDGSVFEIEPRVTQTREVREPAPTRIPSSAEVKPDGKGNLVTADGKIVARAGKEARLYQDLHKTRGQAQTLQGQLQDVTTRLHKAVEIGQQVHRDLLESRKQVDAVKQFGLDQGEHLTALRLFKELRDNPQAALKNILTRAATNGINVAELGIQGGGVDPKSLVDVIRQEIGNAVNPLKERTEAEKVRERQARETEEQRTKINGEVNSFFNANPDARQYLPVFTQTIKQFPDMTLGEVWARIQLHQATNPQQRRQSQNSTNGRSLPSGRSVPPQGDGELAPVSDSYETIVRAALDKAGIR